MVTAKKATPKTAADKPAAKTAAKPAAKPVSKAPAKANTAVAKSPAKPKAEAPKAVKPRSTKASAKPKAAGNRVPADQRAHYIEVAAYHIAERRGFAPGNPMEDWLAAEAEIDRLLAEGRLG